MEAVEPERSNSKTGKTGLRTLGSRCPVSVPVSVVVVRIRQARRIGEAICNWLLCFRRPAKVFPQGTSHHNSIKVKLDIMCALCNPIAMKHNIPNNWTFSSQKDWASSQTNLDLPPGNCELSAMEWSHSLQLPLPRSCLLAQPPLVALG